MIEIRNYSSILSRGLGFIKKHRVRLSAGLVVVIGAIFIGVSPFTSRVIWIVSLSPLVLGAFVPLLSSRRITDSVNGWEEEFSSGVERTRMSDKKEARYVERPLHGTGLAICRMTGPVGSDHLNQSSPRHRGLSGGDCRIPWVFWWRADTAECSH
jgi:hypothetical protein